MKKIKFLFLLGLFSVMSLGAWAQFSGSGTGTQSDPYLIFNPIQLNQIRNFLNNNNVYFKMMADVDLTEWIADNNPTQGWQPIGTEASPFKGKLDGNGYTIKGLSVNRPSTENVGFFGSLSYAKIHDVTIYGNIIGEEYVGGLSGLSTGATITNVSFIGDVTSIIHIAGGLIGYDNSSSTLDNCCFEGNVKSTHSDGNEIGEVGGLIGAARTTTIKNSIASGNVEGPKWVGGLIGRGYESYTITKSGAVTDIISTGDYVGGLVGECDTDGASSTSYTRTIQNCFSIGSINARGSYVGGLVGRDYGHSYCYLSYSYSYGYSTTKSESYLSIYNSYHSGVINGKNYVGGIIGQSICGRINKTYCIGDISGNLWVGGIVGYMSGKYSESKKDNRTESQTNKCEIKSSISISDQINATTGNVGRVIGTWEDYSTIGETGTASGNMGLATAKISKNGIIQECTDGEQNGTSVGKSTLKIRGTYQGLGWDFSNDWDIQETECYPYMMGQAAPPVIESGTYSGSTEVKGKSIDGGTVYLKTNGKLYSAPCVSNEWTIETDPLQAGQDVIVYAKTDTKGQSYFTTATITYPGKGTEDDPYLIYTAADLAGAMGNYYYKLMNYIDLTDYIAQHSPTTGWVPIGKGGSVAAHFDGDGHIVSGLWINSSDDYVGLFSNASGATIKNLTVVIAANKKVKGGNYTGGLIGRIYNGKIENCSVQGDVEGTDYVGGLSGADENSTYNNNSVVGNVEGTVNVGGVTGISKGGNLSNLTYSGNITSTTTSAHVGGLAGYSTSNLSLSSSQGTIAATGLTSHAGGVVGTNMESASVANSYSTMNVTTTDYVGGVVGYNYGKVENCYSTGNLSATYFGGGIIGYNDGTSSKMTHCVAANNYIVIADETGWASRVLGGLKNSAPTPDMNNYAYKEMTVSINNIPQKIYDDNLNGTAKTIDFLKSQTTYESLGWDFENVWKIDEGQSFPYLDVAEKPSIISVTSVSLNKSSVSLEIGETVQLTATVLPQNASNKKVKWTTSNAGVATVEDGLVTTIAAGSATITATSTDGTNFSASCTVKVKGGQEDDPDTDYSVMSNAIYIEKTAASVGSKYDLSINLKNEATFGGFQFDLYLPEGITVALDDEYEEPIFEKSSRINARATLEAATQIDGSTRFLCYSTKNYAITDTDGEILTVTLNISDELGDGDYPIYMKNIILSTTTSSKVLTQDMKSTITLSSYTLGDVNDDKSIDVVDISCIASYILGNKPEPFIEKAADFNEDESIDVVDISSLASYILNGPAMSFVSRTGLRAETETPANLQIIPFAIQPGEELDIDIELNNPDYSISGTQYDIYLPEGLSFALDEYEEPIISGSRGSKITTEGAIQGDGALRMLSYSSKNYVYSGTAGAIATVTIKADENVKAGVYTLQLRNMFLTKYVNKVATKVVPADYDGSVVVGTPAEKNITLVGNLTSDALDMVNTVWGESTNVASFDMTQAVDVDAETEIVTGNANTLYYIGTDKALANESNVVVDGSCTQLTLTDGYNYNAPVAFEATNAKYTRNFKNHNWQALYLPYEVAVSSISGNFEVAEMTAASAGDAVVIEKLTSGTLAPNKPYFIRLKSDKTAQNYTFSATNQDIAVTAANPQTYGDFTLTGIYVAMNGTQMQTNNAFGLSEGKFCKAQNAAVLNAFRFYLTGASSDVKIILDDETGIEDVDVDADVDTIYNLAGQKLVKAQKGVNIMNGKKVIF